MATRRSGDGNGSGFNNTALTTLKMAVFAPIPSASVSTAIKVNPGDLRSWRRANVTSFISFGAKRLNYIDARGACRDTIFKKTLRLRSKRQPDAELPCSCTDRKCEYACDANHCNRQRNRGKHAKHHRVQTLRSEYFSAVVLESTCTVDRLIRRQVANNSCDRRDE